MVASGGPFTRASLGADLARLGVLAGSLLIVHSSLSRLGWVAGGEQAVLLALLDAVGPQGTLVMPTHSGQLSDPAGWQNPPVPSDWWPVIRAHTPAYDPRLTPTRGMGAIVECFRHLRGVRRSAHPTVSFAAFGPLQDRILDGHGLRDGLGETSPLARLYDHDGWILLLGVGHENNTSLHLAEHRSAHPGRRWVTNAGPISLEGRRRWVQWRDLEPDGSDFPAVGDAFAATGGQTSAAVGAGQARLMRCRPLVDFAAGWFSEHRTGGP